MAGFSLGGGRGGGGGGGQEEGIPPESLFLYPGGGGGGGSAATYSRGFELWQHQQIPQHPQQQLYSTAGLLRFSDDPIGQAGQRAARGGGGASGSTAAGGMSCQDCGNQAKKDCSHLRCRTCCKSRGFQCSTHVKSTWVPASKRRERQQQQLATAAFHRAGAGTSAAGGEPSKRPREIITTTTSGGGMEAVSFPSEVSSPAVFRCVRVSPMDDAEDEYAYQTAVSIGGHVFKGILYDQGPESQYSSTPRGGHQGDSSSSSAAAAVTAAAAIASTSTGTAAGSTGLLDPSSLYPTPLSAFMAGTQFFPHHPRP